MQLLGQIMILTLARIKRSASNQDIIGHWWQDQNYINKMTISSEVLPMNT